MDAIAKIAAAFKAENAPLKRFVRTYEFWDDKIYQTISFQPRESLSPKQWYRIKRSAETYCYLSFNEVRFFVSKNKLVVKEILPASYEGAFGGKDE